MNGRRRCLTGGTKPTAFRAKFSAELSNLRFGRTSRELPEYIDCRIHEGVKSAITYAENISASRGDWRIFRLRPEVHAGATTRGGFILNVWKIKYHGCCFNLLRRCNSLSLRIRSS